MYQVIPLLLVFAMLMPWTGPSDPGNRMAAANAADGLAERALIYHQTALAYVMAHPGTSGAVPVSLPAVWTSSGIAACAKVGLVETSVTVPTTLSKPAVAAAMARLWGGYPLAGLSLANALTNPVTGTALSLPCVVADQTPVLVSQAGG
jgi:hypothetical protein